jgi:peptidoglycan/LPS O-acetylase OafA/YrhL
VKYSRIVLFSVGLYLLLVVLSAIATLIVGTDEATQSMPFFFTLYVLGFVISLIAYFYLGYKQATSPYKQAAFVAVVFWFIDLGVNVLLYIFLGTPIEPLIYLIPVLLHVIAVLLGTLLGVQLRHKRELSVSAI